MLHGMVYEQRHCLDVRDDISKQNIFCMLSSKSLVWYALTVEII